MTSPHDETTVYASVAVDSQTGSAPPARGEDDQAAYGPDEERLVRQARQEALLRLARAM